MSEQRARKTEYGNWVSKKLIYLPSMIGLLFLGAGILFPALLVLAGTLLLVSVYFWYCRYLFSPRGGNFEERIRDLVLPRLNWNGEGLALDIGCGNGALTIKLAHKYTTARAIGIDFWGGMWEYSKTACENNARIEQVNDRVTFQKATASALPFEDEYFDAALSNLVFHEVRDTADKRKIIKEALRVVKKGGRFAFQDLFLMKRTYGNKDDLLRTIRSWGIRKVEFIESGKADFIPTVLRLPFMAGTIAIIAGEK